MNWLKELAPYVGTALGGPLGGVAATFIAEALGLEEKTVEKVSEVLNSGKMSADQIAALKLAEIEFQKFCKQNQIDLEKIAAADRDSARNMQIATRSKIPGILSIAVTVGYFGVLIGMLANKLNIEDSQALLLMLGSLSTAWTMIISFWFGSTFGSQNKDQMLAGAKAQPQK